MKLFEKILEVSDSVESLEDYLMKNIQEIYDFENSHISIIDDEKEEIRSFILQKTEVLNGLNYKLSYNKAFIIILYDLCERFGFQTTISLESVIRHNNLEIGSRLNASRLYLLNVTDNIDLINRFDEIVIKLQYAQLDEGEEDKKTYPTFANYVAYTLINTSSKFIKALIKNIETAKISSSYSFLNNSFIDDIIDIDFEKPDIAYKKIQVLIETFVGRDKAIELNNVGFFIESDSDYTKLLDDCHLDFEAIRDLSVKLFISLRDNTIFYTLLSGVAVLKEEKQLFAYMNSYGPMHKNKLTSAFAFLSNTIFSDELNIIDWGCGQALATLVFLDYYKSQSILPKEITLIEPSLLALKRGALHIKKYVPNTTIVTINKFLNDLNHRDFSRNIHQTKIHLFSNILDMEVFSITKLINCITSNFRGINYFVCVSPYVDDKRTGRIDAFVNRFSNMAEFELLITFNDRSYEWLSNKSWTRVVRVFKVLI